MSINLQEYVSVESNVNTIREASRLLRSIKFDEVWRNYAEVKSAPNFETTPGKSLMEAYAIKAAWSEGANFMLDFLLNFDNEIKTKKPVLRPTYETDIGDQLGTVKPQTQTTLTKGK